MQYAPGDLKPRERYKVLTSFVLPRPIAWVTTVGPTGVVNAAPFSFFNVFCEDPPLCMFAANRRPDGRAKDTQINIERTAEFVVNMTDELLAQAMHETSGDFPPEIGEPNYLNLKLAPSTKIAVPRLADAPFAMECKTWKTIDVNGERMVPPIIAAMPIRAHNPVSPMGINFATAAPSAPPIISKGASTPPEVPDPSAIDQTNDLPTRRPSRATPRIWPFSKS